MLEPSRRDTLQGLWLMIAFLAALLFPVFVVIGFALVAELLAR